MRSSKYLISLLIAITSLICFGQSGLKFESYKLENGLTVYLCEDHNQPKVKGEICCRVGGKNDPVKGTGMAHYLEHMLFKGDTELGTSNWKLEKPYIDTIFMLYDELALAKKEDKPEIQKHINSMSLKAGKYAILNELDKLVSNMGGSNLNANTSNDRTCFFNTFPPNQMERWLDLYSHRFIAPVFRAFQSELETVYEEKNISMDKYNSVIYQDFTSHFYKDNPYAIPVIGTTEDLKNPSLTKMMDYYKTYYVPNNMALILVGDFDIAKLKPMIAKSFGKWATKPNPPVKEIKDNAFKGREFFEVAYSPINIGMMGYKTCPSGDKDDPTLEVINAILTNSSETGLFDKVIQNGKIPSIGVWMNSYVSSGGMYFYFVPKVNDQSLEEGENIVLSEINKIKKGEFNDTLLNTIKLEKYRDFKTSLETIDSKANDFVEAFILNKTPQEIFNYAESIKAITRESVIRVANKYFTDNYLCMYSKIGELKNVKIDKPPYEPIEPAKNAKSTYADYLETVPQTDITPQYLDFNKSVATDILKKGVELNLVKNTINDIFTLTMNFGAGTEIFPNLNYGAELLNYAGTLNSSLPKFKQLMGIIGCNYAISANKSYLVLTLTGPEENLGMALNLLNELLISPSISTDKLSILLENAKASRKAEKADPNTISSALNEYIKYKNKSKFIDRLTLNEIENLDISQLLKEINKALHYQVKIHYVGVKPIAEVKNLILSNFHFADSLIPSNSPIEPLVEKCSENTVYFVDKKDANQSLIRLNCSGDPYLIKDEVNLEAFNEYFGGGMYSIVFQEIREYRSLAYTAQATYARTIRSGNPMQFMGYVGTQADKTLDALDAYMNLIRNMPQKPERMDVIKRALYLESLSQRPSFRDRSRTIERWKLLGYTEDPLIANLKKMQNLSFNDVMDFYSLNLKARAFAIGIVGDKARIDIDKLSQYGKIISLGINDLFRD